MYTVYEVYREGKELPESQWVKVVGEIEYGIGGTKRNPQKTARVHGSDFKPLLGDIERAVVTDGKNGHFAIEGEQKASHERGMYWAKKAYRQVWLCVPVTGKAAQ